VCIRHQRPLYALFLNSTLKEGPEVSNTEALCNLLIGRLKTHEPDIDTEIVRVVDYNVKPGIGNDGGDGDEWPQIHGKKCVRWTAVGCYPPKAKRSGRAAPF